MSEQNRSNFSGDMFCEMSSHLHAEFDICVKLKLISFGLFGDISESSFTTGTPIVFCLGVYGNLWWL
jgi:hypothetical protein